MERSALTDIHVEIQPLEQHVAEAEARLAIYPVEQRAAVAAIRNRLNRLQALFQAMLGADACGATAVPPDTRRG